MTRSKYPTQAAARQLVKALTEAGQLDDIATATARLAITTGRLVDNSMAEGEKGYSASKAASTHLAVILALRGMVRPPENDPLADFIRELSIPTGATVDDESRL